MHAEFRGWYRAIAVVVVALALVSCSSGDDAEYLRRAIERGDIAAVEGYLDDGVDPNAYNDYNMTAIHEAVVVGDLGLLEMLYAAGADPSIASEEGTPALALVARKTGSVEVGQWLVEHGVDVCEGPGASYRRDPGVSSLEELARDVGHDEFADWMVDVTRDC